MPRALSTQAVVLPNMEAVTRGFSVRGFGTFVLTIPATAVFEFWLDRDRWCERNDDDRWNSELWQIKRFNDSQHLRDLS